MSGYGYGARRDRTDSMATVRAVLAHEQKLGFTDRATIGGLARFWERWAPDLGARCADEASRAALEDVRGQLAGYGTADAATRERVVSACLALVNRLLAADAPNGAPNGARHEATPSVERPPAPHARQRIPPAATEPSGAVTPAGDASIGARRQPPVQSSPSRPASSLPPAKPQPIAATAERTPAPVTKPARRPSAPADRASTTVSDGSGSALDGSVATLRGVGSANAAKLARLGVASIRDILYYFPVRHIDYRDTRPISELAARGSGVFQTIQATVVEVRVERLRGHQSPAGQWMFGDVPEPRPGRPGLLRIIARLRDATGSVTAVWIRAQDYLSREFTPGRLVMMSGEIHNTWRGEELEFADPDFEFVGGDETIHTGRLVPVYRLTQSLGARGLRRIAKFAVDRYAALVLDFLPREIRQRHGLLDLATAISQIHFPDTPELLERARRRLVFDEFFLVQYSLIERKEETRTGPAAPPLAGARDELGRFLGSLPFALTGAQRRALDEVIGDVGLTQPMSRLIQGDVGSGKTVVAAAAALVAVASGRQAAIMAPTEILAEQHYRTFEKMLAGCDALRAADGSPRPIRVGMLAGSQKPKEKRAARAAVASGEVDVVIGTHALIQDDVEFARLGLAIVDEQHRFGVLQRGALRDKGEGAHLLVMTATPIPRTLALTVYGDLEVSVIDELPPGRQEIRTKCFGPNERAMVYEGLRQEVRAGHQAYVICPLVEESERLEAKAAVAEFDRLRTEVFPDLRLGLLHGRMKPAEKDEAMRAFQRNEIDVLVATAVVEVGVDVPNATYMIIEGADRFGLAQLHQFRGRIGRGSARSYCALLAENAAEGSRERLEVVASTRDGFKLAEADLRLRGPGEFFGTRQSGLPDLKLARPGDESVLEEAREVATTVVAEPALLRAAEREILAARIKRLWEGGEQH